MQNNPDWQPHTNPSQQPTQYGSPGPPPPPPKPKRRTWLWIILWVLAVLVLGCVGLVAIARTASQTSTPPVATQAPAGNTPQTANTPVPTTAPTPIPATPTLVPTKMPTPTPQTSTFPATHGRPHIGGPFSDFVGKYGQPIGQGQPGSYNFQSDTARPDGSYPAGPNVTPNAAGVVIGLTIVSDGATTVSFDQARLHCEVWLPSDATLFNTAPPYIDYHSSVGEIVMMVNDFGDCVLSIAQS